VDVVRGRALDVAAVGEHLRARLGDERSKGAGGRVGVGAGTGEAHQRLHVLQQVVAA
jgi:hypothetical protein